MWRIPRQGRKLPTGEPLPALCHYPSGRSRGWERPWSRLRALRSSSWLKAGGGASHSRLPVAEAASDVPRAAGGGSGGESVGCGLDGGQRTSSAAQVVGRNSRNTSSCYFRDRQPYSAPDSLRGAQKSGTAMNLAQACTNRLPCDGNKGARPLRQIFLLPRESVAIVPCHV